MTSHSASAQIRTLFFLPLFLRGSTSMPDGKSRGSAKGVRAREAPGSEKPSASSSCDSSQALAAGETSLCKLATGNIGLGVDGLRANIVLLAGLLSMAPVNMLQSDLADNEPVESASAARLWLERMLERTEGVMSPSVSMASTSKSENAMEGMSRHELISSSPLELHVDREARKRTNGSFSCGEVALCSSFCTLPSVEALGLLPSKVPFGVPREHDTGALAAIFCVGANRVHTNAEQQVGIVLADITLEKLLYGAVVAAQCPWP